MFIGNCTVSLWVESLLSQVPRPSSSPLSSCQNSSSLVPMCGGNHLPLGEQAPWAQQFQGRARGLSRLTKGIAIASVGFLHLLLLLPSAPLLHHSPSSPHIFPFFLHLAAPSVSVCLFLSPSFLDLVMYPRLALNPPHSPGCLSLSSAEWTGMCHGLFCGLCCQQQRP